MGGQKCRGDFAIAALADRQHGVVARRQLRALGCTGRAVERRLGAGRLHAVHRGVYAVGRRRLDIRGRWMAAVLAGGPDAVLSHRDAAALHELRRPSSRAAIEITAPGRSHRTRAGITVHNVRHLHPDDRTVLDGIPVTSVHRTLLDFAEVAGPQELRWAFEAYDRSDRLDMRKLEAAIGRAPGRGVNPLCAPLANYLEPAETRSNNERRFLALIREAGLPEPGVNVAVAGIVVDFYWAKQKLVVEIDSYRYHHTPADRAEDRRKTRELKAAGREVMRVPDTDLDDAPRAVVGDVEAALSAWARSGL